jgi:hypothetical protein
LLILRQLSENRQNLLKDVLFFELSGEETELGGASTSNHGGVLITEFDELLPELFLLGTRLGVAGEEQVA